MNDMNWLRALAASRMPVMGNVRWFTPTPAFWDRLERWRSQVFVDAGCGTGEVTRQGLERGFDFVPVDMVERDSQIESVLLVDACSVPYSERTWPLICRPDHSGWAYDCLSRALEQGATGLYVGLTSNVDRDLDDLQELIVEIVYGVGVEGEDLYVLQKPLSKDKE